MGPLPRAQPAAAADEEAADSFNRNSEGLNGTDEWHALYRRTLIASGRIKI